MAGQQKILPIFVKKAQYTIIILKWMHDLVDMVAVTFLEVQWYNIDFHSSTK